MGHREDLLAGAKRLVKEKSFGQITARDLVAESGTNLASIGYHFGSKEALLNAAILATFDEWGDAISLTVEVVGDGEPVDRLEAFLDGIVAAVHADRTVAAGSAQALAVALHAAEVREQVAETFKVARRDMAALLLLVDPTEVTEEQARTVGSLAMTMINGMVLQWLIDPDNAPTGRDLAVALRTVAGRTT
ncbi:TetR/AcrR family transcriptional regulator [Polymorphospora sp. NPDC051019]|uniref:TetR/AcrR family transcriptional regulator n=1 Tax=unclassified Polymorphospora TaxID=2685497 RepID=UPI0033DC1660